MEPFRGMKPTQVIRAVADKGRRPEVPEGVAASPDVVPLMEQCWKQNPAERPEGFGPVVRALASVVMRDGDPRFQSTRAVDVITSSGANRGGAPSVRIRTAPPTASSGVDASSLDGRPVEDLLAIATRLGVITKGCVKKGDIVERIRGCDKKSDASAASGSTRDVAVIARDPPRIVAKETGVPEAQWMYASAPSVKQPIAGGGIAPSSGTTRRFKKLTKMFGRKLSTRVRAITAFKRGEYPM